MCVEARDRLRKLREEKLRRSDEVVELWEDFLECIHYKLGTECMYHNHHIADFCIVINHSYNRVTRYILKLFGFI